MTANKYSVAEVTGHAAILAPTDRPRQGIVPFQNDPLPTIRTFMKRFTRLALGFSKKFDNLEAAVALHMAYYNFCWRPGKMRITPAMSAGVTNSLWSFDDLMAGGR